MTLSLLDRLARKSMQDGDCLIWTGKRHKQGYGRIAIGGPNNQQLVHRVAWVQRHGPIPRETPFVLHICDNPPCFKDEHLYLGTQVENNRDCVDRGRNPNSAKTHCPAGHRYDETNTYVSRNGRRRTCRTCNNDRTRERRRAMRTA